MADQNDKPNEPETSEKPGLSEAEPTSTADKVETAETHKEVTTETGPEPKEVSTDDQPAETEPVEAAAQEDEPAASPAPEPQTPDVAATAAVHAEGQPAQASRRRFHIGKKAALFTAVLLVLVAGTAGAAYQFVFSKQKPVNHFSAVVVEPFKIVSSTPQPDASNVASDGKITLTFNRPVDPASMKGDFYVSPETDGTYSQGKTPEQVVFTPTAPFPQGTKFQFMLHGEFAAKDGSKLGADYFGKFTTALPGSGFTFTQQNEFLDMDTLTPGTDAAYKVYAGDDLKDASTVTIYKSSADQLLRSFVYQNKTDQYGYNSDQLSNTTVSTDGLTVVSTKTGLRDSGSFTFKPQAGVYLAVATNDGTQVGRMWIVASDYGVILRQDDQNAVVVLQNLESGDNANGDVDFYNLAGSVSRINSQLIDGQATVPVGFTPRLDVVVAHAGGQTQVVPVNAVRSLADLRSKVDLSAKPIAFGTTDKPSYKPGETVRFAGYVRTDNDAIYSAYKQSIAKLYVAEYAGGTHLLDLTAPVAADGTFKGSFTATKSFITSGSKNQLHLYVAGDPQKVLNYGTIDADVASFTVTNEAAGQFTLKAAFAKTDYLPTDNVTVLIAGVKADGSALANTNVNVDTFAEQYQEGELNQATYLGQPVNKTPSHVTLDAQGKASFTVDVSQLPPDSSQLVTVEVSAADQGGAKVAGSAAAIVHQGDAKISFAPSRTVIKPSGTLVARVYAKTLKNAALAKANVTYTVVSNSWNQTTQQNETKQLASGSVTADDQGFAQINQPLSNAPSGSLTLTVTTGDSQNNKVSAQQFYYVDSGDNNVYSDVQLAGLDVYGSQTDVQVGDTLHLTVDAPQDAHALMTLERGRIYRPQLIDLHQGKNDITITVTDDLMPSFNLVFSYFSNGRYHVDGVPFTVSAENKLASVKFNAAGLAPAAGQSFTLPLSVTNATGDGLASRVIFTASESSMFNIASPLNSPFFAHLYAPLEWTTNSSSSLTPIGSGGGKCGGGGNDLADYILPAGQVGSWQPDLSTDVNGKTSIPLNLPKGTWHLTAYVMDQDNVVGSTSTDLTVK